MIWSKEFLTALYSLDGIGVKKHNQILKVLIKHEATERDFWVNKHQIWQKLPISKKIEESIYLFKKDNDSYSYYKKILDKDIRVVSINDNEYPFLLKQLDLAPPVIFVKGSKLKTDQAIGVVGTRRITDYGRKVIDFLVSDWAKKRPIISGFKYGVDVYAQRAALNSGGYTVGILGFGFDHMYPAHHQTIMDQFLERGASFISPFAPHVVPKPGNFPARNVLIAGLSTGVCVIEAAAKSGSLFTANMAGELGRDVYAVPGSIFSPFSDGIQELLKQGATLIRKPDDLE